jgi:hypothetical protein
MAEAPVEVHDLGARLVLSPPLGVGIGVVAGLYSPLDTGSTLYWIGTIWFMLMPFTIWSGARAITVGRRQWFERIPDPVHRIVAAVAINALFAVPVSLLMLYAWYWVAGLPADGDSIRATTLLAMLATTVITHAYETMFLIQERWRSVVAAERTEKAMAQAELEALKAQLDPHFLFNSLNALSELIETDPVKAAEFNENLAEVYRYILASKSRGMVPLSEEIRFAARYFSLLELRFGRAVRFDQPKTGEMAGWEIPPLAAQMLVENAARRAAFDEAHPLEIRMRVTGGFLEVEEHAEGSRFEVKAPLRRRSPAV